MSNFEDLLRASGGFGRYQLLILCWFQASIPVVVTNMGFMIFGGIFPDCLPNSTNCSSPQFHSVVMEWSLVGPHRPVGALITSLQMVGVLVGPVVAGQLSDRFGRKPVYLVSFVGLCVVGFCSAFAPDWKSFSAFRFVIGLGCGAVISVQFVLCIECLTQKTRTLVFVGGWPWGFIFLGTLAYFAPHWQLVSTIGNGVGIVAIFLSFFVYESPKWLMERGRVDEANKILENIAKRNKTSLKKFHLEQVDFSESNSGQFSSEAATKTYSYWHLFRNRTAALECLALTSSWFIQSTSYYTVLFNTGNLGGSPAINTIIFAILRLVIQLSMPIVDRRCKGLGRRPLHQLGMTAAALFLLGMALTLLLRADKAHPEILITLNTLALCVGAVVWMMVELYTVELFPTPLRNMGNGLCNTAARLGCILAPQILLLSFGWPPAPFILLFVLFGINIAVAYFLLPETKGRPLPTLSD